ncbi:MAG: esterase family protein [Candidatus Eremiobacteraeota bacterium]|nr:esterase family protein [Candidatus Eremiobacteraeota bacterium]
MGVRIGNALLLGVLVSLSLPVPAAARGTEFLNDVSPALSAFWGQAVHMNANVLLPESYTAAPQRTYPIIYVVPAFNESYAIDSEKEAAWHDAMRAAGCEFIIVSLKASMGTGHHVFADSANNGPWGNALIHDFIPSLEARLRTTGSSAERFVVGHSSGGWSALWLQVTYPQEFAGSWSASPDPVDFRDFTGPDLTAVPPQNLYHDSNNHEYELVRGDHGMGRRQTIREYVQSQSDSGPQSQFGSFDAVFSPIGPGGNPQPLFNRRTGAIDATVAQYWETHYDISRLLRDHWNELEPNLRHKLHIIVGTEDTFHLESSVHRLDAELKELGSDAEIIYAPQQDHFSILSWNGGFIRHVVVEAKQAVIRDAH